MANIQGFIDKIRTSIYGKEVRGSLADGLDAVNKETEATSKKQGDLEATFDQLIINAGDSNAEIVASRHDSVTGETYDALPKRLDAASVQLVGTANLIGFNFEQQGGVPNDDSLETAQANTKLFRDLMYTCYVMGGGTVSFPNGTFYFAKYDEVEIIMAYSNVNVKGVGMEKSILKIIEEESSEGGYSFFRNLSSLNNANYSDFTIDMYAQTMHHYGPGGKAFYIQKLTDCTFKNIKLKGTPSTALGIDHLVNVHIDNVHCYECGRLWGYVLETEGILPFVPTNPKSHNTYPGGAGIGIGTGNIDGENFKITNCTAELCGHYGIFVEHQRLYSPNALKESKDIIIANNICRNNRFAGIGIRGGTRISLVGNESYGNGCYGLSIDSKGNLDPIVTLKESIIIGNIFNENGLDGIHIDGYCNVDGLDIKNNDLLNNTHYGLGLGHYNYSDFTNTIQRNIVFAGNTMYGNKDGDIYKDSNRMIAYVNLIIENNYILTTDPPAENVIDDTDSKIAYFGDGWQIVSSKTCFGGTAHFANTGHGSTFCKFVFNGTGFKLYSPTRDNKGKAAVSVDYGTPFIVDLYTEEALPSHVVAEVKGLTSARHTVTIDYLSSKNSLSSGDGINVDAVVIIGGELLDSNADNKVRVEDGNEKITLEGVWSKSSGDMYSNGICRFTNTTGSYAQFNFTGTQIDVRVPTGPDKGKSKITLNGVETIVDEYTPTTEYNKVVFTADNLDSNTTHSIKIEYMAEKNAASTNDRIVIDSFIIYDGDIV